MATYAIGDIQGCYDELIALLDRINFDPAADRLWFCGDLVNRGPASLASINFIRKLEPQPVVVLGNHDLHLLAQIRIKDARPKRKDTLNDILESKEREDIAEWLCQQKLFHFDAGLNCALVHAGLEPRWSVNAALNYAAEVEAVLRDRSRCEAFLRVMYGNEPPRWNKHLSGHDRLRVITNCFSRIRFVAADGSLNMDEKGSVESAGDELQAWYAVKPRRSSDTPIVFGHWSTLSLSNEVMQHYQVYPIDTGAVWGRRLTALRVDDFSWFDVPSKQKSRF